MNINTITAEDLRRMSDKEGLILQGCGGDLTEWVDGINEMLTHAGILKVNKIAARWPAKAVAQFFYFF